MGVRDDLLGLLADGQLHSGSFLADRLNLSRTAVWKHVRKLADYGLVVEAAPGRGYRLDRPLELLDRTAIVDGLDSATSQALEMLDLHGVIESTSTRLRCGPPPSPGRLRVCAAEYQTDGRGRRGRSWLSPYGAGICLSACWRFESTPRDLSSLSLASGVAVVQALERCGIRGLSLKWPNDVILDHGKVAGILVDVEGETEGPMTVVIGAGLNVEATGFLDTRPVDDGHLPAAALVDAPVADPGPGHGLSRNRIVAALIMSFHQMLLEFARTGFDGFAERWRHYDYLLGREVRLVAASGNECGTACGIAPDGSLLLDVDGAIRPVVSGDVSVRVAS